jgi:hypothetical protein
MFWIVVLELQVHSGVRLRKVLPKCNFGRVY